MKVYTYSQARQKFSTVLDEALKDEVIIKRRGGQSFSITSTPSNTSPFDIPSIKTKATTENILSAIRESRADTD